MIELKLFPQLLPATSALHSRSVADSLQSSTCANFQLENLLFPSHRLKLQSKRSSCPHSYHIQSPSESHRGLAGMLALNRCRLHRFSTRRWVFLGFQTWVVNTYARLSIYVVEPKSPAHKPVFSVYLPSRLVHRATDELNPCGNKAFCASKWYELRVLVFHNEFFDLPDIGHIYLLQEQRCGMETCSFQDHL